MEMMLTQKHFIKQKKCSYLKAFRAQLFCGPPA
jgi:hypothetical protein